MAAPPQKDSKILTDYRQLVEHLENGCKPREQWRIGTEHEKFVFVRGTNKPVPYEGNPGIRRFLEELTRFRWKQILENGNPIALTMGDCNISQPYLQCRSHFCQQWFLSTILLPQILQH